MSDFSVLMYANSMSDFVTSRYSAIEKNSLEECEAFCLTSEAAHPKRFEYTIREKINGKWVHIGGLTRPTPDAPIGCCSHPLLSDGCKWPECQLFKPAETQD